jgi:hypothetical protein
MGQYVKFDSQAYYNALKRAVIANLRLLEKKIYLSVIKNLNSLRMRDLDVEYKKDFISSLKVATRRMADHVVISAKIGGGRKSFRAVYYEYGTGTQMDAPAGVIPYTGYNPARPTVPKSKIYQRPYGVWYDQGGNRHFSLTKGTPRPLANKPGLRGEEIEPQYPFAKGIKENLPALEEYITNAVKSVPIGAYIRIRSIRK